MGRRNQEPIATRSHLSLTSDGAVKVCMDDLTPEQRDYLGALLQVTCLNAIYVGTFEFWAEGLPVIGNVFPDLMVRE